MYINVVILIFLLVAHFIGDFILQSDQMAKNKSKSNMALFEHVIAYLLPFLLLMPFILWTTQYVPLFCIVTGILHFLIDYVTSRINSNNYKQGKIHEFFIGVGADQLIHYICLIFTYLYIYG